MKRDKQAEGRILEDVNLSEISISKDGRNIVFQFSELYKDDRCAEVICSSVYVFNYHNIFEDEYDGLPCYVGEVDYGEVHGLNLCQKLTELNFGFVVEKDPTDPNSGSKTYLPPNNKAYFLHIEGGQVDIDIVCGEVKINLEF